MELKPCLFCGDNAMKVITTRGSTIRCCGCSAMMEHRKMGGYYKNLAMARKWSYNLIRDEWNNRVGEEVQA